MPAWSSTVRRSAIPRCTRRTTWASRPTCGSGRQGSAVREAGSPPLRLAHRGDWRVAPENTIDGAARRDADPGLRRRRVRRPPERRRGPGGPPRPDPGPRPGPPGPGGRAAGRRPGRARGAVPRGCPGCAPGCVPGRRAEGRGSRPRDGRRPAGGAWRGRRAGRRLLVRTADAGRDGRPPAGLGSLAERGGCLRRDHVPGPGARVRRHLGPVGGSHAGDASAARTPPGWTLRPGPCAAGKRSIGLAGWAWRRAAWRLPPSTGSCRRRSAVRAMRDRSPGSGWAWVRWRR